ncbi:putative transcriptional regulator [Bacillus pakistanensis]|uniref:Transcriptional regulator n=1 Tax=Rossellomorea pakistanensis TaxID=992288 RepID=A0ABS2N9G4_9BACI|nr:PadR family transcriptional regulator [Bacillus pakistanensis]MBM7584454.1 putative transcriptional regulator [Bacillus pakistanensis]
MEDRLKNLQRSMKNTTFRQLDFTKRHMDDIHKKIQKQKEKEEDILLAVMQLLVQEKTGYELAKQLRSRGIQKFEDNEGFLYTLLHRLEHKGYLLSSWDDLEMKQYQLTKKGNKLLKKVEGSSLKKHVVLGTLLEVRL